MRHALPVRREVTEGPADPDLSDAGHQQSAHLAEYLRAEVLAALYASPLRRAVQTAAPLAAATGLPVGIVDGVAEFDRLSDTYIPAEEMKATNHPRWQAMLSGEHVDGDESQDEFRARVLGSVEALIDAHPGDKIVVICHGGVINAYLAHVLGLDATVRGFFYPNYTSIHRVVASRSGHRSIVTVNETSHLRGTGLPVGING